MNIISIIFYGLFLLAASASSSTTLPPNPYQTIWIDTFPVTESFCKLQNNHGLWFLWSTPQKVTIRKSCEYLSILCKKGNKTGQLLVNPSQCVYPFKIHIEMK